MTILTDHEQAFADSAEGSALIARARAMHERSEAYRGENARPWTAAMAANVVRRHQTATARGSIVGAAMMAESARQAPGLRASVDQARRERIAHLHR